uniref:Putative ovule protein n=1 Tax=Solanum chacoense TaxID=4108 RepID=A0A0V0GIV7_SOLCH
MDAEIMAILQALRYCRRNKYDEVILETDSLGITKMIRGEWKIPWQYAEVIEEIQAIIQATRTQIQHAFREANQLADKLANN